MTSDEVDRDLADLDLATIVAMFEEYLGSTTEVAHQSVMDLIAKAHPVGAARMRQKESLFKPYINLLFSDMLMRSARAEKSRQFLDVLIAMYPPHEDAIVKALRERLLHGISEVENSAHPKGDNDWPEGDPDSY